MRINLFKLVPLFLISIITINIDAQNKSDKNDRIITRDYKIIECQVSKISTNQIEYTFLKEKLINVIETSKVVRVEFGNGRIQTFEAIPIQETSSSNNTNNIDNKTVQLSQPISQNTIAILPVPFIDLGNNQFSDANAKQAQNSLYTFLNEKSENINPLVLQDIRTTNSLLRKANINFNQIDEYPSEDLQKILGVDHILALKVTYTTESSKTTYSDDRLGVDKKEIEATSSTYTSDRIKYNYKIYLEIYRNGVKIFNDDKIPFWRDELGWEDGSHNLIKNSNIYKK